MNASNGNEGSNHRPISVTESEPETNESRPAPRASSAQKYDSLTIPTSFVTAYQSIPAGNFHCSKLRRFSSLYLFTDWFEKMVLTSFAFIFCIHE